jgi:hypothetical protein
MLDDIRKRNAERSPGKWTVKRHNRLDKMFKIQCRHDEICRLDNDDVDHSQVNKDARFIACASVDIPKMLKWIERAEERLLVEREECREYVGNTCENCFGDECSLNSMLNALKG